MNGVRLLGFLAGVLLALNTMAGGANAHGRHTGAQVGTQSQTLIAEIASSGEAAPSPAHGAAETTAAAHSPASECPGEHEGPCCTTHCCLGAVLAIQAERLPAFSAPPRADPLREFPRDLSLDGLLRPPCR